MMTIIGTVVKIPSIIRGCREGGAMRARWSRLRGLGTMTRDEKKVR